MSKKEAKPDRGLEFPRDENGERSTSLAGRAIIAEAMRACNNQDANKAADACAAEKKWRFKYQKHFQEMVRLSCLSPNAAVSKKLNKNYSKDSIYN